MAGPAPDRTTRIRQGDSFWRGEFVAMASPCELLVETTSPDLAGRLTRMVADEVWRIEDKFSRYLKGNVIDRINNAAAAAVDVDAETANLIDFAVTLFELSDGAFDITSGALRQAWTFDGSDNIPTVDQVSRALELVGWGRVTWRRPRLQLPDAVELDLGGIAKEYAVDRAAGLLREDTKTSCLVHLGGDLAVTAAPSNIPHWKVGIESISVDSGVPASLLNLRVGALATSGDARRFLAKGGVRYGHILDPRTGWPVPDAPRSVTVAADTCTQAGMLSTLAMLKGPGAEHFLEDQDVHFWCSR
jgi:thiamine biosynthesis lipoprotein